MQTFYFLHIPKTAGSTFCFSVLPEIFEADRICHAHDYPQLLPMLAEGLEKYRLFRGHFYYFFTRLLPVRPTILTFLRDPVDRVLSLYDHICREPEHFQHAAMPKPPNGLLDAVRSLRLLPPSFQVTALACDLDPVRTMDLARVANPQGLDEYSVIYNEMIRRVPSRKDLAIACRRLEEMDYVGLVEHYDESLKLASATFGWPPLQCQRWNVAPARTLRDEIKPAIVREIVQANELDFELYEFGKALFAKRVEGIAGSLPLTARAQRQEKPINTIVAE